jgi:hypothetical protein
MNEIANGLGAGCRPIRILRWALLLTLILFVPVGFGISVLSYRLTGSFNLAFVAAGFMSAVFLIAFIAQAVWPCPRCGRRFVHYNAFWPRKCQYCSFQC